MRVKIIIIICICIINNNTHTMYAWYRITQRAFHAGIKSVNTDIKLLKKSKSERQTLKNELVEQFSFENNSTEKLKILLNYNEQIRKTHESHSDISATILTCSIVGYGTELLTGCYPIDVSLLLLTQITFTLLLKSSLEKWTKREQCLYLLNNMRKPYDVNNNVDILKITREDIQKNLSHLTITSSQQSSFIESKTKKFSRKTWDINNDETLAHLLNGGYNSADCVLHVKSKK